MELEDFRDQIVKWLKLGKYARRYKVEDFTYIDKEKGVVKIALYTDRNVYYITVHPHNDRPAYLGCVSSSRKPRAGEDWTRGNDLADGIFDKSTWDNIVADILSCELVDIKRPLRCRYEKECIRGIADVREVPVPLVNR